MTVNGEDCQNDEDYAIVVGINTYPFLRSLTAALRDAAKFTEWLLDPKGGGLCKANVKTVIGPEGLPEDPFTVTPVRDHVDNALIQLGVRQNMRIGRRLYFYFAGHGVGPSFDDVAMLMAPADPQRLRQNIGLLHYRRYFHDHAVFDEVVFILDCCRDRSQNTETNRPDFDNVGAGPIRPVSDLTIMAAAYGEKAIEKKSGMGSDAEPRGLLTAALLNGLRTADATDGLGRITSRSLAAYLEQQVPQMATEARGDTRLTQKPEVNPPQGEIVLGIRTGDTKVRIVARSEFPGDIELLDHNMAVLERRAAAEVTEPKPAWEVALHSNRWYALRRSTDPPGQPPVIFVPKELENKTVTVKAT